jgi:hypothetical protein
MSQNIRQVFVANPITTNASTDLMYFGQSPYGAGNDAAMTFANFNSQIVVAGLINQVAYYATAGNKLSGLTTQNNGLLVTNNTGVPSILAGPGTTGQVLQSNAAAAPSFSTATYPSVATSTGTILRANGTNWVPSTSTFADTYAVSTILYASGSNAVTGLATANSAVLITNSTGVPAYSSTMTNGQLIIGSTGATPSAATLTAGTGVTITNGAASITVAATGATPWVDQTTGSVSMAVNTGYISDNGAGLVTFTLPATSTFGDWVEINGKGSGGWTIAQAAGQQINLSPSSSTLGVGGSLSSTHQFDCVRLRCITANTIWDVVAQQSTGLTLV